MPLAPRIHGQYRDRHGRTLRVTAVDPQDPQQREVQGKVTSPGLGTQDYSTTMRMFPDVWIKEVL